MADHIIAAPLDGCTASSAASSVELTAPPLLKDQGTDQFPEQLAARLQFRLCRQLPGTVMACQIPEAFRLQCRGAELEGKAGDWTVLGRDGRLRLYSQEEFFLQHEPLNESETAPE